MYIPLFSIFCISNSVRVNCGMTFKNWGAEKRMLVGALANSVGRMFILIPNCAAFFETGSVPYTYSPAGSEVWLGAMTICMIFVMMSRPLLRCISLCELGV